ncbi:hypothetical protein [Paenibacillus gansuensis]|uniref:DprA winged helix domain-containing protein n=1 Tax=Paenibacillus gansuensis TaxID=306542 RepID=A0ABW5PEH7_9BACL
MNDRSNLLFPSTSLGQIERKVLAVIQGQHSEIIDLPQIASLLNITEIQANVAVQLLTYKKLLPINRTIHARHFRQQS